MNDYEFIEFSGIYDRQFIPLRLQPEWNARDQAMQLRFWYVGKRFLMVLSKIVFPEPTFRFKGWGIPPELHLAEADINKVIDKHYF